MYSSSLSSSIYGQKDCPNTVLGLGVRLYIHLLYDACMTTYATWESSTEKSRFWSSADIVNSTVVKNWL